jgi:hypothetical protein
MDQPAPTPRLEEQHLSPSDIVKIMILDAWKKMASFYHSGDDLGFARSTKTFAGMLRTQLNDDDKKKLIDLDVKERGEIEVLRKQQESQETPSEKLDKEIKRTLLNFAEERMELLIKLIENSSVIVKDIEIEFKLDVEDLEDFRKFISKSHEINKTEEATKIPEPLKLPKDMKVRLL